MPSWTWTVVRQDLGLSCNVALKHPKAGDIEEPSAVSTSVMGGGDRLLLGMLSASKWCGPITVMSAPVSGIIRRLEDVLP